MTAMSEWVKELASGDRVTESTTTTSEDGTVTTHWSYYYDSDGNTRVKTHHIMFVLLILSALVLFHFRHKIAAAHDRYRTRRRNGGQYFGVGGFQDDLEQGLSSDTFDLHKNIQDSDSRKGLSEEASREIAGIMRRQGVSFDEARRMYTTRQFDANGVDGDGMPRDPKLVTFEH